MRNVVVIALAALVSVGWSQDAFAGKKDKAPAAESTEEAKGIEILTTGIADVDSFFEKAKAPIDTITNIRTALDNMNAELNTALGLAADAPIETALADLKTKAEGKIAVATDGDKPTLSASDAVPENVTAAIAAVNNGTANVMTAATSLKDIPAQVAALIEEGKKFSDPNTLKGMASDPMLAVKAVPKVGKNLKALGQVKGEAEALVTSIDTFKTTLAALGGK